MISKKIISIVASAMIFCFMVCTSVTGVKADDSEVKVVDGSYLTSADSSTGYTPKSDERGEHLMDGNVQLQKQEQSEFILMELQQQIIQLMRWQLLFMWISIMRKMGSGIRLMHFPKK